MGGADADVFQFTRASTNRIGDFEDDVDRLSIRPGAGVTFEDLEITSFGKSGQHTRITCDDIVVEVMGVDRAKIDGIDFDFLFV